MKNTKKEPRSQAATWKQGKRNSSRTSYLSNPIVPQRHSLFKRGGRR